MCWRLWAGQTGRRWPQPRMSARWQDRQTPGRVREGKTIKESSSRRRNQERREVSLPLQTSGSRCPQSNRRAQKHSPAECLSCWGCWSTATWAGACCNATPLTTCRRSPLWYSRLGPPSACGTASTSAAPVAWLGRAATSSCCSHACHHRRCLLSYTLCLLNTRRRTDTQTSS